MGILVDWKNKWIEEQVGISEHPRDVWEQIIEMVVDGRRSIKADLMNPMGRRWDQAHWMNYLSLVLQKGLRVEREKGMEYAFVYYEICVAECFNRDMPYDRLLDWYNKKKWFKDAMRVAKIRLQASWPEGVERPKVTISMDKTLSLPQQRLIIPPAIEKKKTNNILWLIVAVFSACVVLCCIIWLSGLGTSSTDIQVRYVITGSARSALVTYFNAQGGTEQVNANVPFKKDMSVPFGTALSLVAQNNGSGTIICEIWIDGEKVKTSTSTAQYGVVTCADFAQ